ncbi:retrovirus-related pol polyprotein from transposon TNT 1-94 [Tanacetum coccineum]
MTTLVKFMIIAGADNRPPMLEKSLYDSWKSHMELYIENRENGRMILNSVQNDPLIWPTIVEEDGTTRTKRYEELSVAKKLQAECDLKATNIILQGLPPDVYAIVNHHKVAKEIWERVKLLMQDMKLSLQEKECKLYDEFDKFSFVKGETLYQYYWKFAQLINNMNVINMSMRPVQVNTKFLKTFYHQNGLLEGSLQPIINLELPLIRETRPLFKTTGLLCNKFKGDKDKVMLVLAIRVMLLVLGGNNAGGRARVVKCYNCQGEGHMARQCTQLKKPRNAAWFKDKAMLAEAQESGQILDEEQLEFLVDPCILDGQAAQKTIPNNVAFQTKDLDVYDSECDDVSNAKAVLMANLSNYGSDVISEAHREKNNESLTVELERNKERVKTFEQRLNIDLSTREKMIDSQIDDMIKEKLALKQQIDSLEQNLSNQIKENESLLQTFIVYKNESKEKEIHMLTKPQVFYDDTHKQALGYQNPFYLKKAQWIKPTLYDGSVISSKHAVIHVIDNEETLILEEVSRFKMLAKQNDPISKEKKNNTTPINYVELNQFSEDFGRRFVPQQELSAEQAFSFCITKFKLSLIPEPISASSLSKLRLLTSLLLGTS